jgi:hypothetical protein
MQRSRNWTWDGERVTNDAAKSQLIFSPLRLSLSKSHKLLFPSGPGFFGEKAESLSLLAVPITHPIQHIFWQPRACSNSSILHLACCNGIPTPTLRGMPRMGTAGTVVTAGIAMPPVGSWPRRKPRRPPES